MPCLGREVAFSARLGRDDDVFGGGLSQGGFLGQTRHLLEYHSGMCYA